MSADWEPYPDYIPKLAQVYSRLDDQFAFSYGDYAPDGSDRRIFEAAAKTEFAKAGVKVEVRWENVIGIDGLPSGVFRPQIEMYGHIKEDSETDHERMQWGVTRGLADGKPGYVREDGTFHEDPIKRQIF